MKAVQVSVMAIKEDLLDAIEQQVALRDQKAIESPDEPHDRRSANALRELFARLLALPVDHALFVRLDQLWRRSSGGDELAALARREGEILRQYSLGTSEPDPRTEADPESFLRHLIQALADELRDQAKR